MISKSNNLIFQKKSSTKVQGSEFNGPELDSLPLHVSPDAVHDSVEGSDSLGTGVSESVPELTSNAYLIVRPTERIPALPVEQMRPQMLLVDSEGDYQYALSQLEDHLRRATLRGPSWWSYNSRVCDCLSGFVSVPAGVSDFTPDDHASIVIRVIECITAYYPHYISKNVKKQTLDFESEGVCQRRLSQWQEHLRRANPRRLLNYAYVVNVRSGNQPVCTHKDKCDLLCDINGITRCIESRLIDGEFFPHTLSPVDTIHLKVLREIIDVKYLQTPLFSSLNSEIQSWSADYRLAIAPTSLDIRWRYWP